MLTKKFIDSLIGLPTTNAKNKVTNIGMKSVTYPSKSIITMIARPNTVLLFIENGIVKSASAGDPTEIV